LRPSATCTVAITCIYEIEEARGYWVGVNMCWSMFRRYQWTLVLGPLMLCLLHWLHVYGVLLSCKWSY